jgi:hypothetical protein
MLVIVSRDKVQLHHLPGQAIQYAIRTSSAASAVSSSRGQLRGWTWTHPGGDHARNLQLIKIWAHVRAMDCVTQ